MGDDIPAGELNRATKPGQFFGYPWKQGKTRITENGYDKDPLPPNITDPQVYMDAHAADLGMTFYTGKQFPAKYQGGIFSAQHGSWNRTKPIGARVMFTSLKADGTADKTEVFADGWLDAENGHLSRSPGRRRGAARRLAAGVGRLRRRDLPHLLPALTGCSLARLAAAALAAAAALSSLAFIARRRRCAGRGRRAAQGSRLPGVPRPGRHCEACPMRRTSRRSRRPISNANCALTAPARGAAK